MSALKRLPSTTPTRIAGPLWETKCLTSPTSSAPWREEVHHDVCWHATEEFDMLTARSIKKYGIDEGTVELKGIKK